MIVYFMKAPGYSLGETAMKSRQIAEDAADIWANSSDIRRDKIKIVPATIRLYNRRTRKDIDSGPYTTKDEAWTAARDIERAMELPMMTLQVIVRPQETKNSADA